MFVKTGAVAVGKRGVDEERVDEEREEKRRKVIIQAKGRINPDGPPPLLFLEDGSARNRERESS